MIAPSAASQSKQAIQRARQAVRCLPFRLAFYQELEQGALSSSQLAALSDWRRISRRRLSANRTEDHLIWLIQLGVLRRLTETV